MSFGGDSFLKRHALTSIFYRLLFFELGISFQPLQLFQGCIQKEHLVLLLYIPFHLFNQSLQPPKLPRSLNTLPKKSVLAHPEMRNLIQENGIYLSLSSSVFLLSPRRIHHSVGKWPWFTASNYLAASTKTSQSY